MNKTNFINSIKASNGGTPCDLVVKNVSVLDVFSQTIFQSDVGLYNGYFVALGEDLEGATYIDGSSKVMIPGLIDPHIHLESSLVTPLEYAKEVLKHGITTAVCDPHEIANVLGKDGIHKILNLSKNIPFDFKFMLPSCVPATNFESSGAVLTSEDLYEFYEEDMVVGLGEVMNFPAVLNYDSDMMDKLFTSYSKGKKSDGHCASFSPSMLNSYRVCNITTDHECINVDEALERIRRGIYVLIREGTVAKNLQDILPAITPYNSRYFSFCTDDKHLDDIVIDGTINHCIKKACSLGLDIKSAITLSTLNAATCHGFTNKGAICPGYIGDFLLLNSLDNLDIHSVYKNGELVVSENTLNLELFPTTHNEEFSNSINCVDISKDDLLIPLNNKTKLNVIELIPNKLETKLLLFDISNNKSNYFDFDKEHDLLKLAVIERHNALKNIGLGVVKGFKLSSGALATTISHDSHNIIVVGTNDEDMLLAIDTLKSIGGGIVVVKDGQILSSIQLEIAGLITSRKSSIVLKELDSLHKAVHVVAPDIDFNPFLTLSFLALPVIPDVKITDKGLFDVTKFEFIDISE